jgi:hypothetical protein
VCCVFQVGHPGFTPVSTERPTKNTTRNTEPVLQKVWLARLLLSTVLLVAKQLVSKYNLCFYVCKLCVLFLGSVIFWISLMIMVRSRLCKIGEHQITLPMCIILRPGPFGSGSSSRKASWRAINGGQSDDEASSSRNRGSQCNAGSSTLRLGLNGYRTQVSTWKNKH